MLSSCFGRHQQLIESSPSFCKVRTRQKAIPGGPQKLGVEIVLPARLAGGVLHSFSI